MIFSRDRLRGAPDDSPGGKTLESRGTREFQLNRVAKAFDLFLVDVKKYFHLNSPSWLARKFVTQ